MEMEKKKRGRPRKAGDTIQFWQFARAGMAMCAYDQARASDEKHWAAVSHAVQFVKQLYPEMPISTTEVKRILAAWRPRNGGTILRFELSVLTEEETKKFHWIQEQLVALPKSEGQSTPLLPEASPTGNPVIFKIRFGERPNYPRHNRKNPKER